MNFSVVLNSVEHNPTDSLENAPDLARTTASGHQDRGSATAIPSLAENDYEKSDCQPRTLNIDEERLLENPSFFDGIDYTNIVHTKTRQGLIRPEWSIRDAKLSKLYELQGHAVEDAAGSLGKSTRAYKFFSDRQALSCDFCPGRAFAVTVYQRHQSSHPSQHSTCVYCNVSFASWSGFKRHTYCGWKKNVVNVNDHGIIFFYCFQQLVRFPTNILRRIIQKYQLQGDFVQVSLEGLSNRDIIGFFIQQLRRSIKERSNSVEKLDELGETACHSIHPDSRIIMKNIFKTVRQLLVSEGNNQSKYTQLPLTLMMWDLEALRKCDAAQLRATADFTRPPNSEATLGRDLEQQPSRRKANQESHRKRRHSIPLENTTPKHSSAFSHRDTQLPDGTSMLENQDFDGLGDLEGGPHWPAGEKPAKRRKRFAVQLDANQFPSPGRDIEISASQSPVDGLNDAISTSGEQYQPIPRFSTAVSPVDSGSNSLAQASQAALALLDSALPSDNTFGSKGNAERTHTAGPSSTTDSVLVERTQRDNVCTPRPASEDMDTANSKQTTAVQLLQIRSAKGGKGDRLASIDNHSAQFPTLPDPDQGRQSQLPVHLPIESQALASHSDNGVLVNADASPPSRSCQKKSHLPAQIAQARQDLCDKNRELGYAQGVQKEREKEYKKAQKVLDERWLALDKLQKAVHEAAGAVGKIQEELADAQKAQEAKQDAVDEANIWLKRVSARYQRLTNR